MPEHIETRIVHAGGAPDAETGALSPPIHLSSTFVHAPEFVPGEGYLYQRYGNPTNERLESALAEIEGGAAALVFASGLAAGACLLQQMPAGGQVLLADDTYFAFRQLAARAFARWGLGCSLVDMTDVDAVRAAMTPRTCLLWTETPSNPLLKVSDVAALAELAHERGARLLCDATFATPMLLKPLALGADVVLQSTTKYLGGHSDVLGGALIFARDDELAAACATWRRLSGGVASPFASWLTLRGLRTLHLRVARASASARIVAACLAAHPAVSRVHYPGLPTHRQHALATRQMADYGGMLSFELAGGRAAALAVAGRLRLFTNATSLGGYESLVEHRQSVEGPDSPTPGGLLRLSIGLEHPDDLLADLQQALQAR